MTVVLDDNKVLSDEYVLDGVSDDDSDDLDIDSDFEEAYSCFIEDNTLTIHSLMIYWNLFLTFLPYLMTMPHGSVTWKFILAWNMHTWLGQRMLMLRISRWTYMIQEPLNICRDSSINSLTL